jgi:hypothetical protein
MMYLNLEIKENFIEEVIAFVEFNFKKMVVLRSRVNNKF